MSQPKHDAQYLIKKHGPTEAVQIAEGRWREAEEESDRTYAAHCAAVLAYTEGYAEGYIEGARSSAPADWAGANESSADKCCLCGATVVLRVYHRIDGVKTAADHLDVCSTCASLLGEHWHACGCGG